MTEKEFFYEINRDEAKIKVEKLVIQFTDELITCMINFLKIHQNNIDNDELFTILKDGSIAFTATAIKYLYDKIKVEYKEEFLKKSLQMFTSYLQEIK